MRAISGRAVFVLALSILASTARADLTGSSVNGSLQLDPTQTNYFDPTNGKVPSMGYLNSAGTTVAIATNEAEFGFLDPNNQITAEFGTTTLVIDDNAFFGPSAQVTNVARTYKFTDAAFQGVVIGKASDTFPGGLSYSLVGTTLTISGAAFTPTLNNYTAVFTLIPAVPEPSCLALGSVIVAAALARRPARHNRKPFRFWPV